MLKGSILQQLATDHRYAPAGQQPLSFGIYYKNTLVALCHALEDCILAAATAPLVITAFQQGKWYLQEADRYGEISQRARQIVIMATPDAGFAEHPTSQQPNVALVGLSPEDPVSQEWHLLILSPTYSAMVLCQELSPEDYGVAGMPQEDRERKFYGLWTFEPGLIQTAMELAIAHIGRYDPPLQAQLQRHLQTIQAESLRADPTELEAVVSRVVDYLETSHQELLPQPTQTLLDANLVSNELQAFLRLAQLIDRLDLRHPNAAAEVAALVEMMGQLLDLPGWQLQRLRLAALLHRIGPLQRSENRLVSSRPDDSPEAAPASALSCALVPGAQVLRTMPRLRAIAEIITHQTEYWNGSGQPAGLAGDDIPLESRMLGLAAHFLEQVTAIAPPTSGESPPDLSTATLWQEQLTQALANCTADQGDRWDPKLVEVLALIVRGLQQGIRLPVKFPKYSSSLWLLEPQDRGSLLPQPQVHRTSLN